MSINVLDVYYDYHAGSMLAQPDVTLLPDARRGEPEGWRASPWTAVSPTEFINFHL